jgi:hypothetical protein
VATSWFIDAVMETAEHQRPALIEAQDKKTPRSGCRDERAKPMHPASIGSAAREEVQERPLTDFGCAGSRSRKTEASSRHMAASARDRKPRGQVQRSFGQPIARRPGNKSSRSGSAAGYRPVPLSKALPNPSLKPRPNGKTPAPRYSAVHHLQRGAGVSPSVPA